MTYDQLDELRHDVKRLSLRHEGAADCAKALQKRLVTYIVMITSALATFVLVGFSFGFSSEGLVGTGVLSAGSVLLLVMHRFCAFQNEEKKHRHASLRYREIDHQISRLRSSKDHEVEPYDKELTKDADSIISDLEEMRNSAPNPDELLFLGWVISRPGIR